MSAFWQKTDAEVREEFISALEKHVPVRSSASRRAGIQGIAGAPGAGDLHARVLGQVTAASSDIVANVFVLNSAQIANGTLNVNETLGVVTQLPN